MKECYPLSLRQDTGDNQLTKGSASGHYRFGSLGAQCILVGVCGHRGLFT